MPDSDRARISAFLSAKWDARGAAAVEESAVR